MAWTVRFGETLPAERRQPLEFRTTGRALRRVLTTRQTISYTLALAFAYSGFYVYLASTQPIMDTIYGRASQFAVVFGASGPGSVIWRDAIILAVDRFGHGSKPGWGTVGSGCIYPWS